VTTGLLWVLSEPGAVDEIEFHDWYDHEHVPLRTALDGVHTARRFRAIDGEAPGWGAMYDIDLDVLRRPEYTRLRERRSPREQQVVDRLATLDRRSYELVADDGEPVDAPAVLVTTSLTVPPALEPELQSWYAEEHVPLLHAIPGWARTRRYRLLDGTAPRWLALHELTDATALETTAYRQATSTPRRGRLMAGVTERERRVWATHRVF
jgi:hypothetical protein